MRIRIKIRMPDCLATQRLHFSYKYETPGGLKWCSKKLLANHLQDQID
jgi:hypothetical protein